MKVVNSNTLTHFYLKRKDDDHTSFILGNVSSKTKLKQVLDLPNTKNNNLKAARCLIFLTDIITAHLSVTFF